MPLDFINRNFDSLDPEKMYYLHCQGGYRSVIAASILKSRGFEHVINVDGGFNEIKKSCVKVTEYREPSTML
jgi:rhodanese-related sulfurtransferase